MGTRTSDTLKEIESIRSGLDDKLVELERRLPPMMKAGKKALVGLAGGGGGGLALLAIKKVRSRGKAKRKLAKAPSSAPPVVVQVLPKGALPVIAIAVAAWAGVRIFETIKRHEGRTPGVVRPLREDSSRTAV